VMEDQAPRHADAALPPDCRNREVDAARKDVREVVKGKGCLVRKHAFPPRPEPQFGQFLVLGSGVMDDSVDSAPHSAHAAVFDVAAQQLPVEARRAGLLGREEASLAGGHVEELVPARLFPLDRHGTNVNVTLPFVQVQIAERASAIHLAIGAASGPMASKREGSAIRSPTGTHSPFTSTSSAGQRA